MADFEEFVAARWDSLVRFAYLLTGESHEAQDLVQESLARAWSKWPHLDPAGAEAYVRRIVSRLAWRRSRRRTMLLASDALESVGRDTHVDAADVLVGRAFDVARALAALPRDQRVVIVLRYWLDLDEATIAQQLGCRRGTVKSRASRAYARLRCDPLLTGYQINLEPNQADTR
ncbi:SigE family RNA polymerase sigma factor [Nocardioides hungaricus]